MRTILLTLILLITTPAWAIMSPYEKLNNPALEARAQTLTRTLRCVVCQNESVEDSNADIARDLRILVRRQMLAGKTDDQIKDNLRSSYGDYILLDPPVTSRTYALWFAPLIVLGAGLFMALRNLTRWRRR